MASGGAGVTPNSVDLTPLFPGIRDQGTEGCCTGFATAAFREILYGCMTGSSGAIRYRLSPAYLYARTRMAEGTYPGDVGAVLADEFAVLQGYGVCPEDDLPYNQDPKQAPGHVADVAAFEFRIHEPLRVDTSVGGLKTVLAHKMPVAIAMPVFQSFEEPGPGGLLKLPDVFREGLIGGHALSVVGYDERGWKIANSWGVGWGDYGYCVMPFGYEDFFWEAWTSSVRA